jgi:hypothetical protein
MPSELASEPSAVSEEPQPFEVKGIGAYKGMVVLQTNQGYMTLSAEQAEHFYRAVRKATKKAIGQNLSNK